jgi:hypothetical protein
MSGIHFFEPGERFGPCVKHCGSLARYIEIDHRENFGTECPKCPAYKVIVSAVENACDGCGANLGGWRGWLGFPV